MRGQLEAYHGLDVRVRYSIKLFITKLVVGLDVDVRSTVLC
jgi:hypothetical protein